MMRRVLALLLTAGFVAVAWGPLGCEPPKAPALPEKKGGNCCFRDDRIAPSYCGGRANCCNGDFAVSDCEQRGGLWFASAEGCAGAC
jgi:hypothetical protein